MAKTEAVISVTLDPVFTRALARQRELQAFLSGEYVSDQSPSDLAAYIRVQALALTAEVHEVLNETHWKPWAVRPDGADVVISKKRYTGELADVFIFFMNLMLAGDVTTAELMMAVNAKQDKNMQRWLNGYDAKATKCRGCGRSFDDEDVTCYSGTIAGDGIPVLGFCAEKERFIDSEGNAV